MNWPLRRLSKLIRVSVCTLLLSTLLTTTFAHDPGLSNVDMKLEGNRLTAQLVYNYVDLEGQVMVDKDQDRTITPDEFNAAKPQLEQFAREAIEVNFDGNVLQPSEVQVRIARAEDGRDTAYFSLVYPGAPSTSLFVQSRILNLLARGHREYFKLTNAGGQTIAERLLDAENTRTEITAGELSAALGRWHTFKQFLLLGIEHILLGFDHLCFLLALLLVASNLSSVIKIVTSFTIAHSITLALAAFDKVSLSPGIVEPMIAVSIVYVGLENIWRSGKEIEGRWLLTFAFGLIHGFGFAGVLKELNIGAGGSGVAIPLVSFNLGVELGQLAIALLVWPIIWKLRQKPILASRLIPVFSLLVAIAGGYWLIQRTIFT
ncbi:MAG: HupE/UreJ family protein [Acidobacteria bacterium]|nr:HupE/UreJ family protein [Acidobacteriota bacterium]